VHQDGYAGLGLPVMDKAGTLLFELDSLQITSNKSRAFAGKTREAEAVHKTRKSKGRRTRQGKHSAKDEGGRGSAPKGCL